MFGFKMIERIFLILLCVITSKSLALNTTAPSYSLQYDDSIYVEYNDTFDPDPQCSIVPVCQQSSSQWGDESLEDDFDPPKTTGCQTLVNCYEYSVFPQQLPLQATILTIQGSWFKNLTKSNLEALSNLVEIVMEFNELSHIHPKTFQTQTNLEILRLHGNKLKNLARGAFLGLSSLKVLDLSNNGILTLQEHMFSDIPGLRTLDLSLNSITSIGPGMFRRVKLLKSLSFKQNNISFVSKLAFQGLENLKTLNLKQNRLRKIPLLLGKHLPGLVSLFLSRNPIHEIAQYDIQSLNKLRHLWLHDCQISYIEKQAFSGKLLKTLVLEHNNLQTLPDLGTMKKLKILKLNGNPWVCDSEATELLQWIIRHNIKESNVICLEPVEKRGRSLLEYSVNQLANSTKITFNTDIQLHTTNMFKEDLTPNIPMIEDDLFGGVPSGSDQNDESITSTSKAIVSSKPFLQSISAKIQYEESRNEITIKNEILQHEIQHQAGNQDTVLITGKSQSSKLKNTLTKNSDKEDTTLIITIAATVVIIVIILAAILAVAFKKHCLCHENIKTYEIEPTKRLNKIKRRRSGRYDLTRARTQNVKTNIYGVLIKPSDE